METSQHLAHFLVRQLRTIWKSVVDFLYAIVSLIRFPKIETKQMTTPAGAPGTNRKAMAYYCATWEPAPSLSTPPDSYFPVCRSPVWLSGNTSYKRHRHVPIIFSPNKPNQQKKLFFLIKHPHFSWEGTQQTINLS